MQKILLLISGIALFSFSAAAQQQGPPTQHANTRFEQLGPKLPTPNTFRTAAGAPGRDYFQNRADYDIKATLNDVNQTLTASELITYHNNSTDALPYVWLQLDQNLFKPDAIGNSARTSSINADRATSLRQIDPSASIAGKDYGYKITAVNDQAGKPLKYTINQTMMRIDLPAPVKPGASYTFRVDWNFKIVDAKQTGARSGYEYFPKDGNYI
ncbi:MAG: M1 family peptidase, partial [Cytophagaceae bacterium]